MVQFQKSDGMIGVGGISEINANTPVTGFPDGQYLYNNNGQVGTKSIELNSQTATSGFTNGQYLYNNNGKVGAKNIELSSQTTTSGFTNGQYLYNNNGKVGAKAITPASIGALYLNDSGQLSSPAKAYPIDFGYDAVRNIAIMPSSQEDQIHNFAHGTIVILLEE